MSAVFGASRGQAGGVTLDQLSDLIDRAKSYAMTVGTDLRSVEPKVNVTLGGKIRKIEIEVP